MNILRCKYCGRFIGAYDVALNNIIEERIYDQQVIPIEDIIIHIECQLKNQSLNKTTDTVQNEQKGG